MPGSNQRALTMRLQNAFIPMYLFDLFI